MSAATPFPSMNQPMRAIANAIYIDERSAIVPASYVRNPHPDPMATQVTLKGLPLLGMNRQPFVVGQVAEERRWAILESGEVMDQVEFAAQLTQVRMEYFKVLRDHGRPNASFDGNPDREPFPRVERYVSWRVDPDDTARLLPIGYDKNAHSGAKPAALVDSQGEALAEARIETLTRAYHDPKQRARMTASEVAEVQAGLDVVGGTPNDIAAKLEMLLDLHNTGDLSDAAYIKKVAALTGKAAPDKKPAPEPKAAAPKEVVPKPPKKVQPMLLSLCGKEAKGKAGKRVHEMNCRACASIRVQAGG